MKSKCSKCGLSYEDCKYPISHSHPTIGNIDVNEEYLALLSNCPSLHAEDIEDEQL